MSSTFPSTSKRGSGVLSPVAPASTDSRRSSNSNSNGGGSGGGLIRQRGPSGGQRSNTAHSSHSVHSTSSSASTAAATPAHRVEPLLDMDDSNTMQQHESSSSRGAVGSGFGGSSSAGAGGSSAALVVAAGDAKTGSILTVGALEAAAVPEAYVGNVSRHVKDEIDELLYQLSIKEKEIRISRGNVQTEMANIKRNINKMQRDADDLVRQQNNNIASMGKAR